MLEDTEDFQNTSDSAVTSLAMPTTPAAVPLEHDLRSSEQIVPSHATSLPPMDRGFDAWAYLASAWLIEFLVWSYPFSFGVFLNHYTTHEFSHVSPSTLTLVGSTCTGIMYFSSLIMLPVMNRYPWHKKTFMYVGVVLCIAGLVGAAFAKKAWHLILTQSVTYALGGSMLYFPVMTYLWEWFSERKGLANGIIYTGTGIGGVVTPLMVEALLNRYGSKTTLLALGLSFSLIIPAFAYIKPRVPISRVVRPKSLDTRFLRYTPFWILFLANTLQGLGAFLPTLYIPTFASDLNLDNGGTIALSLMNGTFAPGLIFFGYLSDHFDLRISIFISAVGSSIAVLLIWGFTSNLPSLLAFACVYGFLCPSWCALWPRFVSKVTVEDPHDSSSATVMCIFIAGRGIGNVLSAPIASGLLHATENMSIHYGLHGYGALILFTGIMLLASAIGMTYTNFERPSLQRFSMRLAARRASMSLP